MYLCFKYRVMSLEIFHEVRMMKNLKTSREGLKIKRLSAKFVLYMLFTEVKKTNGCLNVCRELRKQDQNNSQFLLKVVSEIESSCNGYDPEKLSSQLEITKFTNKMC